MDIVDRAILVVDSRVDAVVGLRDRVPPERALLRRAPAAAVDAELDTVRPFPFAVAGVTRGGEAAALPPRLLALLGSLPIPVVWWGEPPAGLPAHAHQVASWSELRGAVVALLACAPGGVTLADHRGLVHGRRIIRSPALEGLVAAYPQPFALSRRVVAPARAALARHGLPLRLSGPRPGWVGLEVVAP